MCTCLRTTQWTSSERSELHVTKTNSKERTVNIQDLRDTNAASYVRQVTHRASDNMCRNYTAVVIAPLRSYILLQN